MDPEKKKQKKWIKIYQSQPTVMTVEVNFRFLRRPLTLSLTESNLESMNVVAPFESVYETLVCDHSNESY